MSKFSVLDFSITHLKSHYSIFQKTSALLSAHSPMAYQWMSQITVFQICHLSCLTEAGILHLYSADLQSYCNHQHHLWFYDHKTASSPLPHTSSTASYFLLIFTIQKVVSITCYRLLKFKIQGKRINERVLKIIRKEGRIFSVFLLLCSSSQMWSYLGQGEMFYWRGNRKAGKVYEQ